jgi:hypothetical protein
VIAIDGKTSRRSGQKKGCNPSDPRSLGFRGAPPARAGAGQGRRKSNEIVAIPKLLDMLAIEGTIVTIDAMGCQHDIAQKVVDKNADYVLAPQGQSGLAARGR